MTQPNDPMPTMRVSTVEAMWLHRMRQQPGRRFIINTSTGRIALIGPDEDCTPARTRPPAVNDAPPDG